MLKQLNNYIMAEGEGKVMHYGEVGIYHRGTENRGYDRCDRNDLEQVIADGVQRLQHDVPESTAAIKDSVQAARDAGAEDAKHIVDLACQAEGRLMHKISDNLAAVKDAECSLGDKIMQNRFELKGAESKIIERLDYETDVIKLQMNNFERSTDKNFCEVKESIKDSERRIEDKLCAMENERKNDLINELRHEKRQCALEASIERSNVAFSNQLQLINSQLIQLDNGLDNKITNKIVQIGAGLVAAPIATANNVR